MRGSLGSLSPSDRVMRGRGWIGTGAARMTGAVRCDLDGGELEAVQQWRKAATVGNH